MGSTKSPNHLRKHGFSFTEAGTIFGDELSITFSDPDHSDREDRCITVGWSDERRLLMVSHTDRDNKIRIISARELTKMERQAYEETN